MFNEAVQAAKTGQRRRARDLFTRLLKTEPNNVDYWVWMSATVDSEKEQVFCLQKALKIDPNSVAARRGLVVLGALTPEAANLPHLGALEDLTPILPGGQAPSALAEFVSRNRFAVISGTLSLIVLIVAGVFLYNALRPKPVIVVAASPTRAHTFTPIVGTPGLDGTADPNASPVPTSTLEPCQPPYSPNPATPLATYLCVAESTPRPYVPTESSARPEEAYQSMRRGYQAGDWSRVINSSEQAIGLYPNDPYPYFYLAEAYRNLGSAQNLRDAVRNYQLAISKNGSFTPAYWGRAVVRFAQGDASNALSDIEGALNADPNYIPAYRTRAAFYAANGNYTRALDDLEQARTLAPEDAEVLAQLALTYADDNRPQDALDTANQALSRDAAQALAYYARGRALYEAGQFENADRDISLARPYVEAMEALYPSLWQAQVLHYYGLAKMGIGDDETALEAFNDAIAKRSTLPLAYLARGQLYLRAQDYDKARADFNTAIGQFQQTDSDNPKLAEAYLGNGLALIELNRAEGALSNFQIALRTLPENFEANLGLGRAFLLNNQSAEALEQLTATLGLVNSDDQQAQALYWRARTYRALGRRAEEVSDLQALAELTEAQSGLAPTAIARLTEIGPLPTETPTRTETSAVTETPTAPTPTVTRAAATPTRTPTRTPGSDLSATPTRTPTALSTNVTATTPSGTVTRTRTPTRTRTVTPTRTP